MRQVRPPPRVVPPKPPSHLFDPAPQVFQMPNSSNDRKDLGVGYAPNAGRDSYRNEEQPRFEPSRGPPARVIPEAPKDRIMESQYHREQGDRRKDFSRDAVHDLDFARSNDPYASSKPKNAPPDFDLDVQLQMRQLEDSIRKMLEDEALGGNKPGRHDQVAPERFNQDIYSHRDRVPEKYPIVQDHLTPRNGAYQPRVHEVEERTNGRRNQQEIPNDPYNRHDQVAQSIRKHEMQKSPRDTGLVLGDRGGNSPPRRKGGGLNMLYDTEEHLRQKIEKQAQYSQQLQQQVRMNLILSLCNALL